MSGMPTPVEDERDLTSSLRPAVVIDSAHPERAIRLYLAVRDDFRYDP